MTFLVADSFTVSLDRTPFPAVVAAYTSSRSSYVQDGVQPNRAGRARIASGQLSNPID
jgi:hypothetical protein